MNNSFSVQRLIQNLKRFIPEPDSVDIVLHEVPILLNFLSAASQKIEQSAYVMS